ncbi:response regulator [Chthonobacter rhizosphaerae]|uniref:response regulator n=1 Tax=Chthonobacter rhizosphaerae TaxID=2735553 RepID=UPI0015EE7B3C
MLDIEFRDLHWRVLIADDSRAATRAIRSAIEAFQIKTEIVEVETGAACMAALASNSFDIAFVDVIFPDISGIEALTVAREGGIRTFVALVSAYSTPENIRIARALNAYDFLPKPFAEGDVLRVLDTFALISQKRRLLLVDDSGTARRLISRILGRSLFNFDVLEAEDAVSGFELFVRERPDICMLDLNLGALDGVGAYRIYRAHRPGARLVLISGDGESLARSGATHILKKPFGEAAVDDLMHRILGLPLPYSFERAEGLDVIPPVRA